VSGIGPSAHAGRRLWGLREASRSLAGLRPTRAEKDALRASWGVRAALAWRSVAVDRALRVLGHCGPNSF